MENEMPAKPEPERWPEGVLLLHRKPDSFERIQRFRGLEPEKALEAIEAWLAEEKARVTRRGADWYFEARHGTLLHWTGWHRRAKKRIQISVRRDGTDTLVRARVIPSEFYSPDIGTAAEETAKDIVEGWLAGLWANLGPQPAVMTEGLLRRAAAAAERGRMATFTGAALMAVGLVVGVVLETQRAWLGSSAGGLVGGMVATPGLIALMQGLIALRSAGRLRSQARRAGVVTSKGA